MLSNGYPSAENIMIISTRRPINVGRLVDVSQRQDRASEHILTQLLSKSSKAGLNSSDLGEAIHPKHLNDTQYV